MTNGSLLVVNVPNVNVFFFDMATGKNIGKEKSEHIIMSYSCQKHKFYTIRTLNSNQVLFEIAFDNFLPMQSKEFQAGESFDQAQEKHLKDLHEVAGF